jgi:hypothetical protein
MERTRIISKQQRGTEFRQNCWNNGKLELSRRELSWERSPREYISFGDLSIERGNIYYINPSVVIKTEYFNKHFLDLVEKEKCSWFRKLNQSLSNLAVRHLKKSLTSVEYYFYIRGVFVKDESPILKDWNSSILTLQIEDEDSGILIRR